MDFRSAQRNAWDNKVAKGHNLADVPLEFCLLQGEVAEAFDSWRKGRVEVGEELADAAIYLLGLATMTGVDLDEEIEARLASGGRTTSGPGWGSLAAGCAGREPARIPGGSAA